MVDLRRGVPDLVAPEELFFGRLRPIGGNVKGWCNRPCSAAH
jgi:hypothetical protein